VFDLMLLAVPASSVASGGTQSQRAYALQVANIQITSKVIPGQGVHYERFLASINGVQTP